MVTYDYHQNPKPRIVPTANDQHRHRTFNIAIMDDHHREITVTKKNSHQDEWQSRRSTATNDNHQELSTRTVTKICHQDLSPRTVTLNYVIREYRRSRHCSGSPPRYCNLQSRLSHGTHTNRPRDPALTLDQDQHKLRCKLSTYCTSYGFST